MIQTKAYYPIYPEEFRRNIQENWHNYSGRIISYNSPESTSAETNKMLIYHVFNATVIVGRARKNNGRSRVDITANVSSIPEEIEFTKSLLEEISKVKLMEKK